MKWSWEVVGGIVGTLTIVLGWLKWVFGRNAQVEQNTKDIAELRGTLHQILDEIQKLNLQIQSLTIGLYGATGTNGIRGEIKEVKADLKELREMVIEHMTHNSH